MKRPDTWRTLSALVVAIAVAACGTAPPSPPASASPSATLAPTWSASPEPSHAATPAPTAARWVPAGALQLARASTHAVALNDGRVLVIGSDNICKAPGGAWDESIAAEVFDPATGTWSATGSLNAPRTDFVAVTLPDGRVLVTGGLTSVDDPLGNVAFSSTKLYDPSNGGWSASGLLNVARTEPAAALLADGTVLVAGGAYVDRTGTRVLVSAEIFDPETGTWSRTGDLATARRGAAAIVLVDGRVLVVGGLPTGRRLHEAAIPEALASAEIFDPGTGQWAAAGSLEAGRVDFSLVALPDGGALVAGGFVGPGETLPSPTHLVERLDPRTMQWAPTDPMIVGAASRAAAVLGDGRVLLAGGLETPGYEGDSTAIADAELYDPVTGSWTAGTPLPEPRERASAAALADGSVLLVGGDDGSRLTPTATTGCPEPVAAAVRYIPENVASFPKPTLLPATLGLAKSDVPRASAPPAEAKKAAAAINAFGLDLYRRMLADPSLGLGGKNVVVSPTSIATALAMARAGARGETAAQMDAVLRSAGADKLAMAMNALDAALASRTGTFRVYDQDGTALDVVLKIANAPFAQQGMPLVRDYLDALASRYGAGLRLVDYVADHDAARKVINAWVKKQTAGRIPSLLEEPDVTDLTRLVLVNAMYLKAPWLNPFDASNTRPAPFTRVDGSRITAPTMNLGQCQGLGICSLPYATGSGWRAVELPYLGDSLAMTVILPDNLAAFERQLDQKALAGITGALRTSPPGRDAVYNVAVSMPRFGIETRADLAAALKALGMPLAFDAATADFTGIATLPEGLYIKKVIHQANIDVDEKGTEAAAATAVVMATGGGPETVPVVFKVDRPFLFLLRDVPTGAVLFMGRVVDPSAK